MTYVWIGLTILVYSLSRRLSIKWAAPFTNVVFLSTAILILLLLVTGQSYDAYKPAADLITILLGPATVALGLRSIATYPCYSLGQNGP